MGFPGDSVVKNMLVNAGDMGSIPGPGRSPKEGNGKPLQYSCLENPMDREAWWATVRGVSKVLHTTELLIRRTGTARPPSNLELKKNGSRVEKVTREII